MYVSHDHRPVDDTDEHAAASTGEQQMSFRCLINRDYNQRHAADDAEFCVQSSRFMSLQKQPPAFTDSLYERQLEKPSVESHRGHFAADVTYLQFSVQLCFFHVAGTGFHSFTVRRKGTCCVPEQPDLM